MCRSCPRTEAQEADLWAAPLGQIRLNDIAGWPLLISIASPYGCHAACSASKRARAFFPSLAAAAMLEKKSGELSSGPHRPALVDLPPPEVWRIPSQLHDDRIVGWLKSFTHAAQMAMVVLNFKWRREGRGVAVPSKSPWPPGKGTKGRRDEQCRGTDCPLAIE
jgi:hypothetical protein